MVAMSQGERGPSLVVWARAMAARSLTGRQAGRDGPSVLSKFMVEKCDQLALIQSLKVRRP